MNCNMLVSSAWIQMDSLGSLIFNLHVIITNNPFTLREKSFRVNSSLRRQFGIKASKEATSLEKN